MTFCCRPSKNCLHCRQRRIKCDHARPACSQCIRAGKECVGYREETSFLFRDENSRIIRRAVAAKERSRLKSQKISQEQQNPPSTGSPPLNALVRNVNSLPRLLPPISVDIDNQGLHFFFHHFSTVHWANGRFLKEERRIHMFETLDTDPTFRNAVVSVGLAAMSNVKRDRALLNTARQRYGIAIRAVRDVVQNPSNGNLGNLLKMIVMIAMFEIVDAKPDALNSWTVHITGVAALLRQFPFPKMLHFNTQAELWFYFGVVVKYFQVGGAFPTELDIWPIQRMALTVGDAWPAFNLIDILIRFIRLCATLSSRHDTEVEDIIRDALISEAELQEWENRLPSKWTFVAKETTEIPGTFYGTYHIYQDAWASRVLNHYRLGRLLVNEVILKYISKLRDPKFKWTEQHEQSLRVVNQMATDICIGAASQALFTDRGPVSGGCLPCPLLKGIFMMIYPLAVAATGTGVSNGLRDWVMQTLQAIGHTTGIRQAVEILIQVQKSNTNEKGILGWI